MIPYMMSKSWSDLLRLIERGIRLQKPGKSFKTKSSYQDLAECGENLYTIMLNCWCLEGCNRPKVATLLEFFNNYRNEMCPYESLILITGRDDEGQLIRDQEMPAMVKISDLEVKKDVVIEPG